MEAYDIQRTIEKKRNKLGLGYREASEASGVSITTLFGYDNNTSAVLEKIVAYAEAVGLEIIVREKQ